MNQGRVKRRLFPGASFAAPCPLTYNSYLEQGEKEDILYEPRNGT
jgi:hypothetical protein